MIFENMKKVNIKNVKYFCAQFDFALGRHRFFCFFEDEKGELVKTEIPSEDMSCFSLAEDGQTRFDCCYK